MDNQPQEAKKLLMQVDDLMLQHQATLSAVNQSQLSSLVKSLQTKLPLSGQISTEQTIFGLHSKPLQLRSTGEPLSENFKSNFS